MAACTEVYEHPLGQTCTVAAWAGAAPIALLDREMPRLLAAPELANDRITLFRVWKDRGSKAAAANFAKAHPELGLAPP